LKELTASFVPVIEIDSVTGKEPSHQRGDWYFAGSKKKSNSLVPFSGRCGHQLEL
jgi:hypothetical protein